MSTQTARTGQPVRDADQLCRAALAAAERGWRVFPIRPGAKKPPAVKDWENRATTDPDRIRRCWAHAAYNIGIATGPSGLVVLDVDTPKPSCAVPDLPGILDGYDVLGALVEAHASRIPFDTFTVTTPRRGMHLYFTAPPGVELRNTAGSFASGLGPLLDTRAGGGYVVAPGSATPDGPYEVLTDDPPALLPGWLVTLLTPDDPPAPHLSAHPAPDDDAVRNLGAYVQSALKGEANRVRSAYTGGRNWALNKAAWNLGRLIARGALPEDVAYTTLTEAAAVHVGIDDFTAREADATIRAAFHAATNRTGRAA